MPDPEEPSRNALVGWAPDLGAPTTFVLLRHGVTPLTAEKRFSGHGGDDPALTAEGARQAQRAADLIAHPERMAALGRHAPFSTVDAVLTSPLLRTRQTADQVADALGTKAEIVDDLRECAFGAWDGLTYDEVDAGWPAELAAWLASPTSCPPGGESFDAVFARVQAARTSLAERFRGRTVVLATHVTPVKCFVRDVLDAPPMAMFRMELAPASITVVQWYEEGIGSLRTFNHTAHLLT